MKPLGHRSRTLALELLSARQMLSVNVELLFDINFGEASGISRPAVQDIDGNLNFESTLGWEWVEFDGNLYFAADDGVHGTELWKTDGTEDGTELVADIFAASDSSFPTGLTIFNEELYFAASDGDSGDELWKTDGTDVGTVRVKDLWEGAESGLPRAFTIYQDELFFAAGSVEAGDEIWKTDGTEEGTQLVVDVEEGEIGSLPFQTPVSFYVFNDELFFSAAIENDGPELFKTDGTQDGTVQVANINPETFADANGDVFGAPSFPESFFEFKDELYFVAGDGLRPDGQIITRLYKLADGDAVRVTEERPYIEFDTPVIVEFNDYLYYSGITDAGLWEMFRTNGAGSSELVMDLDGEFNSAPTEFAVLGDYIYFAANDVSGRQLWRTNGLVGDANVSERLTSFENGNSGLFPTELTVFNGELVFNGTQDAGTQVYRFDGEDLEAVTDFVATDSDLDFHYNLFTEFDNKLFFRGSDADSGLEMYVLTPDEIFVPEPEVLDGDADENGEVNFLDFLALANNFGKQVDATLADGDFDGDGEVSFLDFLVLANNFGDTI